MDLRAAKAELVTVEAQEYRADQEKRAAKEAAAKFKAETGFASVGEMLAADLASGGAERKARIAAAQRTQAIAEVVLAPKPTEADMAATALKNITEATRAIKKGQESELRQMLNGGNLGDAA